MNASIKFIVPLVAAAGIGTIIGVPAGLWFADQVAQAAVADTPSSAALSTAPVAGNPPPMNLPDFSALVDRYGPAVVNVTVTSRAQAAATPDSAPGMQADSGDPLSELLRRFQIPYPRQAPT